MDQLSAKLGFQVTNPYLFSEKVKNLRYFQKIKLSDIYFSQKVVCNYHGISIKFHFNSIDLKYDLINYLPKEWICGRIMNELDVFWINPMNLDSSFIVWDDEKDPNCQIWNQGTTEFCIHRDFAALKEGKRVFIICDERIGDGIHNALRWLLPREMLKIGSIVLHSSCIINDKNKANFFLGVSGAGKTTISKLSSPRVVLGDDMNIISFNGKKFFAEPALLGQVISNNRTYGKKYEIDKFFKIIQSSDNKICEMSGISQFRILLKSVSNLFWDSLSEEESLRVLSIVNKVANIYKVNELHFKKDPSFWEVVDGA